MQGLYLRKDRPSACQDLYEDHPQIMHDQALVHVAPATQIARFGNNSGDQAEIWVVDQGGSARVLL
jgi:hypothetical protein